MEVVEFQQTLKELPKDIEFGDLKRKKDQPISEILKWPEKPNPSKTTKSPQASKAKISEYSANYKVYVKHQDKYYVQLHPEEIKQQREEQKEKEAQQELQQQITQDVLSQQTAPGKSERQSKASTRSKLVKQQVQIQTQPQQTGEHQQQAAIEQQEKQTQKQRRPKSAKPEKVITDLENELSKEKAHQQRISYLYRTSRWLPNSSITSYWGKPAFHNYGQGNTQPSVGGITYGNYLKSFNVQPHDGENRPKYCQVYDSALSKNKPERIIQAPKHIFEEPISEKELREIRKRQPIMPKDNVLESRLIVKPDLLNTKKWQEKIKKANQHHEQIQQEKLSQMKQTRQQKRQITKKGQQQKDSQQQSVQQPEEQAQVYKEKEQHEKNRPVDQIEDTQKNISKQIEDQFQPLSEQQTHAFTNDQLPPSNYGRMQQQEQVYPDNRVQQDLEQQYKSAINRSQKWVTSYQNFHCGMSPQKSIKCYDPSQYCVECARHQLKVEEGINLEKEQEKRNKNPKYYQYAPAEYLQPIPKAGKEIKKSEAAYGVIFPNEN